MNIGKEQASEAVPCRLCGIPTISLGTKLCDSCWELNTRIKERPEIARMILREIKMPEKDFILTIGALVLEEAERRRVDGSTEAMNRALYSAAQSVQQWVGTTMKHLLELEEENRETLQSNEDTDLRGR